MEVDFAVLADGIAPRPDGKLDIFGAAFDTIWAMQVPARHTSMSLVIRLLITRQEAENPHSIDVFVMHADGQEIARVHAEVNAVPTEVIEQLPAGRRFGLIPILQFGNLEFPTFGPYHVVIHWDSNEARSPIPLYVERLQQNPGEQPPADPDE